MQNQPSFSVTMLLICLLFATTFCWKDFLLIARLVFGKKVEMEMVIEGSPNMFLHQTFENIVWKTLSVCNNYVIIYDIDFNEYHEITKPSVSMSMRYVIAKCKLQLIPFVALINFCHHFTLSPFHNVTNKFVHSNHSDKLELRHRWVNIYFTFNVKNLG